MCNMSAITSSTHHNLAPHNYTQQQGICSVLFVVSDVGLTKIWLKNFTLESLKSCQSRSCHLRRWGHQGHWAWRCRDQTYENRGRDSGVEITAHWWGQSTRKYVTICCLLTTWLTDDACSGEEPLLNEYKCCFILFPIQYHKVYTLYATSSTSSPTSADLANV